MYFDTHAHYDDDQFDEDRETLLPHMHENGIDYIIDPGSSIASSEKALAIAEKYDFVYAAVGIHPEAADELSEENLQKLEVLAKNRNVVAIGEIGLDYHYEYVPRHQQKECFRRQMELARKLDLPVIIHERESTQDVMEILAEYPDVHGVLHCFSGSWETAKVLLDRGWMLSFTGVITFKNARKAPEVIQNTPIERLMIETDSPYLSPVPLRGQRNCSLHLPYTCARLAELKGISLEEAAAATKENGIRFFRLEQKGAQL